MRELDVADRDQVETFVDAGAERFGRLDVVFNNAGIGAYGKTPDLAPEEWHRIIAIDLHSVFYGCRAAIPHLRAAGGGAIVNYGLEPRAWRRLRARRLQRGERGRAQLHAHGRAR